MHGGHVTDPGIEELQRLLPRCLLPDWVRIGARAARLFRDRLHPERHQAVLARLLEQARESAACRERRRLGVPSVTYPADLPISARREEIVDAIRRHPVVVVAGETGSGKTTQLPKMCLEAGLGIEAKIGCTQPRRVAALSISRRLAEELNVTWGREVGCQIRFDDRTGPETYIKLMTDGILLAETQGDPLLTGYNALILDEAHERSLNIDFLLGHLKGLLAKRPDLKLIITSATIDTGSFSRHFDNAPIIEVSGRMYPVDVVYAPLDSASEERGELTYVEAAVQAVQQILRDSSGGDILVFMPGERDIRETGDVLEGRCSGEAEVIPLFGRLSAGDQQRVFAPSQGRRIIIATNIAETSLTLPGIRFVVDTGLARISRYNPRTRTRRLPVEPISQSSANQRRGRAGRVQDGTCIRLYSEEDFQSRPPFTQPEIQRANLAEVILRMKAFRLGEMEGFPFVNPPAPAAIEGGYQLLHELGALDEARELTALGRDLARLPIDPTLGRMLLQSQREHATRELLIIASGLSIQDPRERPLERRAEADAAHRKFTDPRSDFLTLLNVWNGVHDQWESLRTQGHRRRFCQSNFLSYLRMREWQDLHTQLHGALEDLGTVNLNESSADYAAVHRSILAGLLGHVALRVERNGYQGAGNRELQVFPGSVLFERGETGGRDKAGKGRGKSPESPAPREKTRQPEWLMAGEIVETSQRFARTVAGIDPAWIVELAPHLCRVTHRNPHWSASAGRVLVEEVATLYGLEVHRRTVAYGNLNPADAAAIFVRSALVEEDLLPPVRPLRSGDDDEGGEPEPSRRPAGELPPQYRFLEHNRRVRETVESWQTRVRRPDLGDPDEALFRFYLARLPGVSSVAELNRVLRDSKEPEFLRVTEADLTGGRDLGYDAGAFPGTVTISGYEVEVRYAYAPGEEWDGVTLRLPPELVSQTPPAVLEWSVPGLRSELAGELLASLPKSLRRELQPFPPKVAELVQGLNPAIGSLAEEIGRWIRRRHGIEIPPDAWKVAAVPAHLRPRFEVVTSDGRVLAAGRDLSGVRGTLGSVPVTPRRESPGWHRLAQQWERVGVTQWNFGDLPRSVSGGAAGEGNLEGWPGLHLEDGTVSVRLYRTEMAARRDSGPGFARLVELALQKDFAWLEKDLRPLEKLHQLHGSPAGADDLRNTALDHLRRVILPREAPMPLTREAFDAGVEAARQRTRGLASVLIQRVGPILELRAQVLKRLGPAAVSGETPAAASRPRSLTDLSQLTLPRASSTPRDHASRPGAASVAADLQALIPPQFLRRIPFGRLEHVPRYLKAMLLRLERAAGNAARDTERMRQVAPFVEAVRGFDSTAPESDEELRLREEFRWMVEEFKVSLFAQELGTSVPVSAKRLEEIFSRLRRL
ncbi:MAG: ATP-dependent RNA helicase HrpA [Verrucomicrobiales bacterium]|nr:ATP-dependent RNA helicase HrpA [Verrucomicrobiales bacterium]